MHKINSENKFGKTLQSIFSEIKVSYCIISVLGSILLAFGLYNVHSISGVTEGGILGLTLLLDHWFKISPAFSGFIFNTICYASGWKYLGKNFLIYSIISTAGFSASYKIFEQFDPLVPEIANHPLIAAIVGAIFVGISAGLCVRVGGAPSGDDALAMSLSKILNKNIESIYLISDLIVLLLSLSYIPFKRIFYSLITVILSGQIIGIIQRLKLPSKKK